MTAAYTSGASSIQVNDAAAFFPSGSTTPVTATATLGSFPIGSFYLTGYSGTTLFVNPTASSPVSLSPGTILTATVTVSGQTSAASIFPSFITSRTNQMAIDLVQYFNSLPLRLPYFNAPPHTPNSRGAIQNFVYGSVAGGGTTTSQQQALVAPPAATIAAGHPLADHGGFRPANLQRDGRVGSSTQSRIQTLNGVSQIYAGRLLVSAPSPKQPLRRR